MSKPNQKVLVCTKCEDVYQLYKFVKFLGKFKKKVALLIIMVLSLLLIIHFQNGSMTDDIFIFQAKKKCPVSLTIEPTKQ